ncbi:CHAP domain-containing protein [Nocardia cyriacigeorgica]|uniref:Peptidase C51 domain-containing protein n=1 Tax=Nocardia cyriacigeorgica TaxID=135487 RepID=A0A4U8W3W9_9NOCA|nr:CHAP domain-containing protein [Nocardia cyriacigeorgica]VFA99184.1 Uncharacterised protein [Nocardia cyriacigeorgica]
MSLKTDLAEIDAIPVRGDFPPGLVSVVRMVKHALRASVMQFASGEPGAQPDLLEQLRKAKLLRNSDIDGVEAKTDILEKYGSRKSDFQAIEDELETKKKSVDGSVSETFSTADSTYREVMGKVRTLSNALANEPGPSRDEKHIPAHAARRLVVLVLNTTDDVHDLVDDAKTRIQEKADAIRAATQGAKPVMANAPNTMGGRRPISMPSSAPAPASYSGGPTPVSPNPTPWSANAASFSQSTGVASIDAAIRAAEGEIGVSEYADNRVNRPYNINDEWCASFTDWAWTQAGMDVNWTNKNLVRAVWADAQRWGWADNISGARPGDMIVWGHQNHIGLVVARNGNTVTVVEGNSGKAVQRNTYSLDRGFAGVIHPPASSAQVAV